MLKITINELVDFNRRTTENSKRSLAYKLKHREKKVKPDDGKDSKGGDYLKTSTSCIGNVFKQDIAQLYDDKINELKDKIGATDRLQTKNMHQRNINILSNFKDFNFEEIRPFKISKFQNLKQFMMIIKYWMWVDSLYI